MRLNDLIHSVKKQGLEGLVAKRLDSTYEPGKRRRRLILSRERLEETRAGGGGPCEYHQGECFRLSGQFAALPRLSRMI